MSTTVQRNGQSLVDVDGVLTVTMPATAPGTSTRVPITHRELPAE